MNGLGHGRRGPALGSTGKRRGPSVLGRRRSGKGRGAYGKGRRSSVSRRGFLAADVVRLGNVVLRLDDDLPPPSKTSFVVWKPSCASSWQPTSDVWKPTWNAWEPSSFVKTTSCATWTPSFDLLEARRVRHGRRRSNVRTGVAIRGKGRGSSRPRRRLDERRRGSNERGRFYFNRVVFLVAEDLCSKRTGGLPRDTRRRARGHTTFCPVGGPLW